MRRIFPALALLVIFPFASRAQIRITTSPTQYVDSQGNVWTPDKPEASAGTLTTTATAIAGALPGAKDQTLYQAERYGTFTETVSGLANGNYTLTMKFSENYWTAAGKRKFNVTGNGAALLTGFDIFSAAGGEFKAIDETFPVTITNGSLVIAFSATVDNAKIDSLSLAPVAATSPPVPPASGTIFVQVGAGVAWGSASPPQPTHVVELTWAASTSSGVTGYNVYRSTTSGGPYSKIASVTGLAYTDSSVASGTVYFYVLTAVAGTLESVDSNQTSAAIP